MFLLVDVMLGCFGTCLLAMLILRNHPHTRETVLTTAMKFAAIGAILLGPITLVVAIMYGAYTLFIRKGA